MEIASFLAQGGEKSRLACHVIAVVKGCIKSRAGRPRLKRKRPAQGRGYALSVQDVDLAFFGEEVPHTFLSIRGWMGIADEHKLLVEGDLTWAIDREGADPYAPSGIIRIDDALGGFAQLRIDLREDE